MRAGFVNPAERTRRTIETVLVYDLGGGTFDATVMRIEKDRFTVLGHGRRHATRRHRLGRSHRRFGGGGMRPQFRVDPRTNPAARESLRAEAEAAKRSLTARPTATVAFAWEKIRVRVLMAGSSSTKWPAICSIEPG